MLLMLKGPRSLQNIDLKGLHAHNFSWSFKRRKGVSPEFCVLLKSGKNNMKNSVLGTYYKCLTQLFMNRNGGHHRYLQTSL